MYNVIIVYESSDNMKKIYIVLTSTTTYLARIIRTYTKDEYSHSSISLDKELNQMYSFGRLNPYIPWWGGFTRESIDFGSFKRFQNAGVEIYSLEVTEGTYKKIKKTIEKFKRHKDEYTFNIPGLFAVAFNKRITKDNSFYCAEFVKHILEDSKASTGLPDIIRPENFRYMEGVNLEYTGTLKDYVNIFRTNLN